MENIRELYWLFPAAFLLHNLEEAIWLPAWSKKAKKFHKTVSSFQFRFAVLIITFLGISVFALAYVNPESELWNNLFFSYLAITALNVIFPHLVATFALQTYAPGLAAGLLFLLPANLYLLREALYYDLIDFQTLVFYSVPLAIFNVIIIRICFSLAKFFEKKEEAEFRD